MRLSSEVNIGVMRGHPVVRPAKNRGAAAIAVRIADNAPVEDSGARVALVVFAACEGQAPADAVMQTTSAAMTVIRRSRRVLTHMDKTKVSLPSAARMSRATRMRFKSGER
jgi:hypothetical protein